MRTPEYTTHRAFGTSKASEPAGDSCTTVAKPSTILTAACGLIVRRMWAMEGGDASLGLMRVLCSAQSGQLLGTILQIAHRFGTD